MKDRVFLTPHTTLHTNLKNVCKGNVRFPIPRFGVVNPIKWHVDVTLGAWRGVEAPRLVDLCTGFGETRALGSAEPLTKVRSIRALKLA